MKMISLKLDDDIFTETEKMVEQLKISRNKYINEAIDNYNRQLARQMLARQYAYESKLVRAESMNVLREFEGLDHDQEI